MSSGTSKPKRPVVGQDGKPVIGPHGAPLMESYDPAQEAEIARVQRVKDATAKIDAAFESPERKKQYGDFVTALRSKFGDEAKRQKDVADRNLKFSLARGGLTGGSSAVDAGKMLRDEYNRGILTSENQAQAALGNLMSQDQSSRLNLIQLAQSGLDTGSAARNAAESMRANIQASNSGSAASALGDIFGGTADIYKKQQQAAEFRRGQTAPLGSIYGTAFNSPGGGR